MQAPIQLDAQQPVFPPLCQAHNAQQELLAVGGNLAVDTLVDAYSQGIFPWFGANDPILWYSPDPRMVLPSDHFHSSRSLKKTLRTKPWRVGINYNFDLVIRHCAQNRSPGTWLGAAMVHAYQQLHSAAYAHSVEVYDQQEQLLGGLYGVGIGRMFFGESMFSHCKDASKVALHALCQHLHKHEVPLIDCQVYSDHLYSLGAQLISRQDFIAQIKSHCQHPAHAELWQTQFIEP